jgi:hypothetical protein
MQWDISPIILGGEHGTTEVETLDWLSLDLFDGISQPGGGFSTLFPEDAAQQLSLVDASSSGKQSSVERTTHEDTGPVKSRVRKSQARQKTGDPVNHASEVGEPGQYGLQVFELTARLSVVGHKYVSLNEHTETGRRPWSRLCKAMLTT